MTEEQNINQSDAEIWTIKHKTRPGGCTSSLAFCGYDKQTLLHMMEKGYELYHNGKKVTVSEIKSAKISASTKSGEKFTKNSQPTR